MMLHSLTTRALIACSGMACVFTGLSARLIHLQVTDHVKYTQLAAENHGMKQVIQMKSGGAPQTVETIVTMTVSRMDLQSPWLIDRLLHAPKPKP